MDKVKSIVKSISKSYKTGSGKGLLGNKNVLYMVTFIALLNILGFVFLNNYKAIVMFFAIGVIAFNFNKNMIIVLLCCILATNLYVAFKKPQLEGFENDDDDDDDDDNNDDIKQKNTKGSKETADKAENDAKSFGLKSSGSKKTKGNKKTPKNKSGFQTQGKNVVAKNAAPVTDDAEEVKSRIDYGTTIERAYDNLDNILGGQNMQKLTKDTTRLISKQNKLVQNMQGMAPMITQYKDLLKNMNLDSIQNLATKLTGGPLSLGASSTAPAK